MFAIPVTKIANFLSTILFRLEKLETNCEETHIIIFVRFTHIVSVPKKTLFQLPPKKLAFHQLNIALK